MSLMDGFKTLVWAVVLLALVLYLIAIAAVFLGEREWRSYLDIEESGGSDVFVAHFYNLPITMYSLFECMNDGCAPTVRRLVEQTQNEWYYVLYAVFIVITVFGVLNLFTAQFVENSMEAARKAEDRIRREADKKKRGLASQLLDLLMELRAAERIVEAQSPGGSTPVALSDLKAAHTEMDAGDYELLSRESFVRALSNPRVRRLLEQLDLEEEMEDLEDLFDTLDADGSGTLSIKELV